MTQENLDRNALKVQALRERLANLTVEHEDRAADYRVEITLLSQENERLASEVRRLTEELTPTEVEDVPEEAKASK